MNGVGAAGSCGGQDLLDVEVALAGGRGADVDGAIGGARVHRAAIRIGEDGDGVDAELAAGAHHADRDLAAVRDEDAADLLRRPVRGGHGRGLYASVAAGIKYAPGVLRLEVLTASLEDPRVVYALIKLHAE